ncbi:MAG: PadR family transcriptional regulator [Firmicutes bacterium]|nr:PadR family transcriptional regulator [Bacillota bacterium]
MDAQLKRGLLEICVLTAIKKEDSYGYKIIKDISPYVEISESTLYPILKRLEASGCITVYTVEHNSRLRKYYKITESGINKIYEFLEEWKSVMKAYDFIKEEYDE